MKYTVKNKDGELTYGTMEELKVAYVLGLVEAEDEVLEENTQLWRKAGGIPLLVTAKKVNVEKGQSRTLLAWTTAAILGAVAYFYVIIKGFMPGYFAVLLGIPIAGLLLKVTTLAAKQKRS